MIKSFFVIHYFLWGEGGAAMIASFRSCIVHSISISSSSYTVFIGAKPESFYGGRGCSYALFSLVP